MLFSPLRTRFRRVSDEYSTVSRFDTELLACALFWGADRRLSPTEVEALVCRLPGWIREQAQRVGVNDPMIQSLIIDHVRHGWVE
jgi:hypothetical protein